ncbi:hypothetical protein [Erythrobacter sp.]|uniref:hypothetical protein n=1 Tax=Erythrobacter sp. TaxID=1042 RepID=UPI001425F19C|nr:hypothetical protein [Erythrobacter sp.]QIQ86028.1 MAG: hypothetical protein G9473_04510 [Erythrobacter sp.]
MTIPNRLLHLIQGVVEGKAATFPATEIFNEGWMLRLLLDALSEHPDRELTMGVRDGSSWSSEVLLPSPFLARFRGDTLAEKETHADAVIGDFDFRPGTRAGLQLRRSCKQFVVVEAKMSSNLSAGVKNATDYDQAARNVACMAHVLAASGRRVEEIEELGFYVIAPEFALRAALDTNLERLTTP